MALRVWLWLLSLTVLWGGSFFFAKVAVSELGPFTVVFARVSLAALALALVVPPRWDAPWRAYFAMGFLNNALPFSLIFWGQTEIAVGLASILNATTPLFTLVVAHFLTPDEKIDRTKIASLLFGLLGVVVLIGPAALNGGSTLWGQAACLAAALSYAFAGVYGRRFRRMGVAPTEAAAGQVTASALLILPIMLVVDRPWTLAAPPSLAVALALAGLALLSTALAYVLYFRILAAAGATNLLLVTLLIPVPATLLGALVLGEPLEPRQFAGMALIGVGLALIDGRITGLLRPAK
ncbi:Threonine/homoserine efflux transporter RhtA [Rhodospirillales bacterium URHD0017]|nr:Threonine/homoserine efflux transporter RhtA [Rhodospirillales bacterium URHD0017]